MGKIISNGIEYVGLTNINGVFIDTNNEIVPSTTWTTSMTYTATEDCFVIIENDAQNGHFKATIDGIEIYDYGTSGQYVSIKQPFAVKMGQVFGATTNQNNTLHYAVYGIQQGSINQGSSGGIDYSTTEQKTGQKWIDGKDIYQKTYAIDISESQTGTVLISDYDYIVKIEAVLNNNSFAFPIFTLASSDYFVAFVDKSTNLLTVLRDAGSSHTGIAYVTVQYTKSTT